MERHTCVLLSFSCFLWVTQGPSRWYSRVAHLFVPNFSVEFMFQDLQGFIFVQCQTLVAIVIYHAAIILGMFPISSHSNRCRYSMYKKRTWLFLLPASVRLHWVRWGNSRWPRSDKVLLDTMWKVLQYWLLNQLFPLHYGIFKSVVTRINLWPWSDL